MEISTDIAEPTQQGSVIGHFLPLVSAIIISLIILFLGIGIIPRLEVLTEIIDPKTGKSIELPPITSVLVPHSISISIFVSALIMALSIIVIWVPWAERRKKIIGIAMGILMATLVFLLAVDVSLLYIIIGSVLA